VNTSRLKLTIERRHPALEGRVGAVDVPGDASIPDDLARRRQIAAQAGLSLLGDTVQTELARLLFSEVEA
jgi:hypothetical protein